MLNKNEEQRRKPNKVKTHHQMIRISKIIYKEKREFNFK